MEAIRTDKEGRRLVKIGDRTVIGEGTVVGQPDNPSWGNQFGESPVYIGGDCSIGNFCSISENVIIGERVKIGNNVVIRSGVTILDDSIIGHGTVFEGDALVGRDSLIHAQCHITRGARIGDRVFIAPMFVGANDPICMRRKFMPGQPEFIPVPYVIEDDARIGIGVKVLPGVIIGKGAQVAVGSVVTKNVGPYTMVMGIPAKFIKNLERGQ